MKDTEVVAEASEGSRSGSRPTLGLTPGSVLRTRDPDPNKIMLTNSLQCSRMFAAVRLPLLACILFFLPELHYSI